MTSQRTPFINEIPISDKTEITEGFNFFVAKIGTQTSSNIQTTNNKFASYMPLLKYTIFCVSSHDISSVINTLKPKPCFGRDGIFTKIV